MSCGLGAIILVFMLVRLNIEPSISESERLQADLERLRAEQTKLQELENTSQSEFAALMEKLESLSQDLSHDQAELSYLRKAITKQAQQKTALEEKIKKIEVPQKSDPIDTPETGQEDYLIGLRVKGSKIAVLVDASASMTDERLIDIIRRKNGAAAQKKEGPKWQRSRAILAWLLARVPDDSSVAVVAFSDSAKRLGGDRLVRGGDANGISRILADANELVPHGATNLQVGLDLIAALRPSDLYLITDGLPTDGNSGYRSLSPFSDCSALWGGSSTISGACRARLFAHTVNSVSLPGTKVNVILLPIEGDPQASVEMWKWTARTKGLLITPAATWP
ncbi:MAG: VWA domain-containing protein [Proteobacteria bacterium]|nr:VWA domain-containing protein [Pseudomonadota bacterium]